MDSYKPDASAPAYNKYDAPVAPVPVAPMRRGGDQFEQAIDANRGGYFAKRPQNTPTRLILNFDPARCTAVGTGLWESDRQVHPALESRGVTQAEWDRYFDRMVNEVQSRQISICSCVTMSAFLLPLPYVCWQQNNYQSGVKRWVDDFNQQVLMPKGMFAKFQTCEVYIDNPGDNTGGQSEEISWLAVALTPEEVQRLKEEPIFWWPGCCNEGVLTKHPCGCWFCFCCCCVMRTV